MRKVELIGSFLMTDDASDRAKQAPLLGDFIRQVQDELIESQRSRIESGKPALFVVDSLTIEVNVIVGNSSSDKRGIDLKVIKFGIEESYKKEQVHKISLTLKAMAED